MTMPLRAKIRTIVRSKLANPQALRWGFAALGVVSPERAAAQAAQLFFRARRHARPAWETELLEKAKHFLLQHERGSTPAWSWGSGPTVLLVHGWEGRGSQLGSFVPPLVAAGYRAVAVDLPGHGEADDARTSVVGFAQALTSLIPQLGPLHGIIAHSIGAAASTLAYTMRPYQAQLVLLAPPRGPRIFFNQFADHLTLTQGTRRAFDARLKRQLGFTLDELDVQRFGAQVPLPALVLHDRADKDVPFSHGVAVADALPYAWLIATEGLGHRRILRDTQVIQQSLRFLADARGAAEADSDTRVSVSVHSDDIARRACEVPLSA